MSESREHDPVFVLKSAQSFRLHRSVYQQILQGQSIEYFDRHGLSRTVMRLKVLHPPSTEDVADTSLHPLSSLLEDSPREDFFSSFTNKGLHSLPSHGEGFSEVGVNKRRKVLVDGVYQMGMNGKMVGVRIWHRGIKRKREKESGVNKRRQVLVDGVYQMGTKGKMVGVGIWHTGIKRKREKDSDLSLSSPMSYIVKRFRLQHTEEFVFQATGKVLDKGGSNRNTKLQLGKPYTPPLYLVASAAYGVNSSDDDTSSDSSSSSSDDGVANGHVNSQQNNVQQQHNVQQQMGWLSQQLTAPLPAIAPLNFPPWKPSCTTTKGEGSFAPKRGSLPTQNSTLVRLRIDQSSPGFLCVGLATEGGKVRKVSLSNDNFTEPCGTNWPVWVQQLQQELGLVPTKAYDIISSQESASRVDGDPATLLPGGEAEETRGLKRPLIDKQSGKQYLGLADSPTCALGLGTQLPSELDSSSGPFGLRPRRTFKLGADGFSQEGMAHAMKASLQVMSQNVSYSLQPRGDGCNHPPREQ